VTHINQSYLSRANIQDAHLRYKWDDWDVQAVCEPEDAALYDRLGRLSHRALMAFTTGCGEWVVYRFEPLSDDDAPRKHMEAAWAGMVDPWYSRYWEPPDRLWLGPVRGPLQLAIIFTLEAKVDAEACGDVALSAVRANELTEHVLTDSRPFSAWREHVLQRLEPLYPYRDDDPSGDVVPREALDPGFDFQPELTEKLVQEYLRSLNPQSNRFLRTASEMLENGFGGTPYSFDIQEDRRRRADW